MRRQVNRWASIALIVAGLLAGSLAGTGVAQEGAAEKQLAQRMDCDFQDTPLLAAIDLLREQSGLQFVVLTKTLEEAGIDLGAPVQCQLKQVRLRTALTMLLDPLALTYFVRDDIVFVTTPEHAESQLLVRVYDCRDLLALEEPQYPAPPAPKKPEKDAAAASAAGSVHVSEYARRAKALIGVVTTTVAPSAWDEVGGPGTIADFSGLLVVSQTYAVHQDLVQLLADLRAAAQQKPPTLPAAPADKSADKPALP